VRGNRIAAAFVQIGLAAAAVLQFIVISAVLHQRQVLHDFVDGTAGFPEVDGADHSLKQAQDVLIVVVLITATLFVIWLWRLRKDAGVFHPGLQRMGQPWVIAGWIIPFANLVIPYLVVSDVAAASVGGPPGPTSWNPRRPGIVKVWWTLWVVAFVGNRILSATNPDSVEGFDTYTAWEIGFALLATVTAIVAIVLVEQLTRNDAVRWSAPSGPPQAPAPTHRW
jgi:hypothetical protein